MNCGTRNCGTAVSDLEVVSEEEDGHMWHIRYPVVGSDDTAIVATTRPETLLGDVAVAVNPTTSAISTWLASNCNCR